MRQNSLLIGLGGTGSRVVNAVAERLSKESVRFNDNNIGCIVYDTNRQDTESIISTGAGVPVIKISTEWTVQEYFRRYEDKMNMSEWCPLSPAFMATGMNDGASEVRIKSRIAFMHTLEDNVVMQRIKDLINQILEASENNLRIMIVTSVAGGTGAGMFLQMALWLRKYLEGKTANYTVRGIFMMPEIFSNTLDNIKKNDEKIQQHRANAYASIKELNFINGVMYGKIQDYPERIVIENVFDSDVDANKGKQLFDYAFLVDHLGKNGTYLKTFDDYIDYVRDMVFMQLYEPLTENLYSDEDNLFRQFIRAQEPLFGACGTSKVIYPKDNVLHTFELRCMKKMLSDGWEYLDTEIESRKKDLEEREAAGETVPKINEEELFIELYDQELERNKNQGRAGKLFQNIAHGAQNEKYVDDDGANVVQYSDKAEDYLAVLDQMLEDSIKASTKKMSKLALAFSGGDKGKGELKTALEREISDYVKAAEKNEKIFAREIDSFKESGVASCAYEIIRKVFPLYADNKGEHDGKSVCSVLTKLVHKDGDRLEFIHPLAMRYVLYKLKLGIIEKQKGLHVDDQEEDARDTNYPDIFDNKKTKRIKEQTALAYLNSKKGLFQSEKSFKEFFLKGYQSYLGTRMNMIAAYEKQALEGKVYSDLLQYLSELIKQLEKFFKNLPDISDGLEEELKSVMKQCKADSKTMYVYATPEAKNKMFEKLQVDFGHSDAQVNASIINAARANKCFVFI